MEFISGCIKSILEKYADPTIEKIVGFTKSEWEKFTIDSDIAFMKYLKNLMKNIVRLKLFYIEQNQNIFTIFLNFLT